MLVIISLDADYYMQMYATSLVNRLQLTQGENDFADSGDYGITLAREA